MTPVPSTEATPRGVASEPERSTGDHTGATMSAVPGSDGDAGRRTLHPTVRKAGLMAALVAVFLTFGLPRFLNHDASPVPSNTDAAVAKLCRDHHGTPAKPRGSGPAAQPLCTVRYGQHVYVMDAITPRGFDADTAKFQRQGCDEARREQRSTRAGGQAKRTFTYHPDTGVCEHRP